MAQVKTLKTPWIDATLMGHTVEGQLRDKTVNGDVKWYSFSVDGFNNVTISAAPKSLAGGIYEGSEWQWVKGLPERSRPDLRQRALRVALHLRGKLEGE